jgi:glycosyltransferase involved in cell wall biosynthesis
MKYKNMNNSYVLITPARNEEAYIEKTIQSVISQSVKPLEWIIINDGSTDKTREIIEKYVEKYNWIKIIERPDEGHRPGVGVVEAFYTGYSQIENKDFDYIVKLDGDLSFEPFYFEKLFQKFKENPRLGMASGKTYVPEGKRLVLERCPDYHVRGASKVYKKECFKQIGGLSATLGWDTIDELKAQMKGWETRSYKDLVLLHYKRIGLRQKGITKGWFLGGQRFYYIGYHPIFIIAKGIYRMFDKPYIIGGLAIIFGYFKALLRKEKQINDKEMIRFLRKQQLRRLIFRKPLVGNNNAEQ